MSYTIQIKQEGGRWKTLKVNGERVIVSSPRMAFKFLAENSVEVSHGWRWKEIPR